MKSSRPYLIRALYEWIDDNECTVHILVNTKITGVQIPAGYDTNGEIVLNISSSAVNYLSMDNDKISFTAAFKGIQQDVYVPIRAVKGIYAKENGLGMMFDMEELYPEIIKEEPVQSPAGRPSLKLVK